MAEIATEKGPYTPAPWAPDFAQTAESIYEGPLAQARQGATQASEREQQAIARRGTAVKEAIGTYRAERKAFPEPPPVQQITPPPSRQLTDFLAPVENQTPQQTVMQMISALTMLGTGIGGLAKGDARAALASLTGAMTGWQQGQRERADRAFADWKANTDALLTNANLQRQRYLDIMENTKLSNAEKLSDVHLAALEYGDEVMAAAAAKRDANDVIGQVMKDREHIDSVMLRRQQLEQSWQLQQQHLEIERGRLLEMFRRDAENLALKKDAAAERIREFDARMAQAATQQEFNNIIKEAMIGLQLDKPARNRYWDPKDGEVRQASVREVNDAIKGREPGKPGLTELNSQQVQLVERLAVAPRIFDRIDEIIDKVSAAAPGQNLTTGLINTLQTKAGISPDLQELRSLNLDAALELAAALSGGQPRISILAMLRGEATAGLQMTAETAHRAVDTARTTVRSRLASTTGDPNAMDKIAAKLPSYGPKKMMRIRQKGNPNVVAEGPEGPVPEGWEKVP